MAINKKTAVLMVTNSNIANIGGIESHVRQLSLALEKYAQVSISHLYPIRTSTIFKKIPMVADFKRLLAHNGRIHFHGFSVIFVVLLAVFSKKQNNVKWIWTPHMHPFSQHKNTFLAWLFFQVLTKRMLKKMDTIIVLSTIEKKYFSAIYPINKIALIPNSIKAVSTNIMPKNKRLHFLFVGRYNDNKRAWLIEKIAPLFPNYNFIFVTDKTNLITKDNLIYHNNIDCLALNKLYSESIAVIIPSKYEAFSMVALESLSAGTPVIMAEGVQIKEYLTDDVITLLAEKSIENELINAIKKLSAMDEQLFNHSAQKAIKIAEGFLWENIVHQIARNYQ